MAAKVYIANTPLILQAADGTEFRVEAGGTVELTAEQYAQVAAHVTAGEIRPEDSAAGGEAAEDGMPSAAGETSEPQETDKPAPKRSRKPKTE